MSEFPRIPCRFVVMMSQVTHAQIWGGTILVAARSTTALYIGADSKAIGGGTTAGKTRSQCKIIKVGRFVFASAGIVEYGGTRFNVHELFRQAVVAHETVQQVFFRFVRLVDQPLSDALVHIAQYAPADFQLHLNKQLLTIFIAGVENNEPVLYSREYTLTSSARGRMEVKWNSDTMTATSSPLLVAGPRYAIDPFIARSKGFEIMSPLDWVTRLIEMEIATGNPGIGPPIDIIRINGQGISWVRRKPLCAPNKKLRKAR